MATITSTSTTTASTAATAKSAVATATQALLTSLGTGSGVDTGSLVTSLVEAQFAAKTAALTARNDVLTAQISATSTLKNTMSTFSTALGTLITGGTLQTQPNSSNASVLTATALSGAKLANLSSSITVSALASAQGTRSTTAVADRTATIGSGTFTLTLGTATYNTAGTGMSAFTAGSGTPATITVTNASLDGIASAINAAKAGVTASVIADADGKAYLSLKGETGTDQAFTLKSSGSSALTKFNVGVGAASSVTSKAGNASLVVDGVAVTRSSNTISDLITGVKLQLTGTSTTAVSLTSTRPTSSLSQAVTDFVDTYNQVLATTKELTDVVSGDLKSDPAAKTMLRSLQALTTRTLVTGGATGSPTTLAQIGVATNRDGTLTVNATTLAKALADYPDEVEAMFAATTGNSSSLQSALTSISTAASSVIYGLGASAARYTAAQSDLGTEQDKITSQSEVLTTRLTQQFSSMNSKVSAYKATQTFLENQIAAWNADS